MTFTKHETVDDLEGPSLATGLSAPVGSAFTTVGGEVLTNVEMDRFDGFSVYASAGISPPFPGGDLHTTLSLTETTKKINIFNTIPIFS